MRNRTIATKSIFVGATRLASKLSPNEGQGGPTTPGGSGFLPGLTGIFHRSQAANQNALNALKNPHLRGRAFPGQGLGHRSAKGNQNAQNVNKNPNLRSGSGLNNAMPDGNFLYFYHPDHLGSTAYVTDGNAKLFEHMEYFPFGETWVDQHSNTQRVPYLFTGKEYDEATGLYYFGARYYDPRTSVWESPDPILARYLPKTPIKLVKLMPPTVQRPIARFNLPHNGGVFNSFNLALYTYVGANPLEYVDVWGLYRALVVKMPNGTKHFAMTHVKNSYQAKAFHLPKGAKTAIAVPKGVNPQAMVNHWRAKQYLAIISPTALAADFAVYWRPHGPHDYKRRSPMFDAFGNFAYGATGAVAGFSRGTLTGMASALHYKSNNPINTQDIESGYNAIANGGTLEIGNYTGPKSTP